MRINLTGLRYTPDTTQTYYFNEPYPPFSMGPDLLTLEDPVDVCLKITRIGKSFLVSGSLKTQVNVSCARCLEDFVFPVDINFEDEWILAGDYEDVKEHHKGGSEHRRGNPGSREDVWEHRQDDPLYSQDVFYLEQEECDVTERVMEHFIVSLPMRFVCSGECRGLCPQCGNNLNLSSCDCQDQAADSRLELLAQWKFNAME
jgi:uncharacterized protein